MPFTLVSDFKPSGDQPQAIKELIEGVRRGDRYQTLLGVTGSGKTYTVSNVIAEFERPVLVMSHNKTLAAQLYGEFRQFFPKNRVEFFISYDFKSRTLGLLMGSMFDAAFRRFALAFEQRADVVYGV